MAASLLKKFHRTSVKIYSDIECRLANTKDLKQKPHPSKLVFGKEFSDHMLEVAWSAGEGWSKPLISPVHNIALHPYAKVFHYASELFEGMKAYRGVDGNIRLFRPEANMERMNNTAKRACLPTFDGNELIQCMKKLISVDQEWVPYSQTSTLYIRPTMIGIEPSLGVNKSANALLYVLIGPVGPYYPTGMKPISLLADSSQVRAWPGGAGAYKMGSNYAPTIFAQQEAVKQGCQQVLWLYGEDHQLTEVGTMNIFMFWTNEQGEKELVTPPLDSGLILPGVTRRSLLDLSRQLGEFKVSERVFTMGDVQKAVQEDRLIEMFGAGTACVVCPIERIKYEGQDISIRANIEDNSSLTMRFLKKLTDIQFGVLGDHPWLENIE